MDNPKSSPPNKNKLSNNKNADWLLYSGMAFEMFIVIGVFTTLGYYADKKLHTAPFLLIVLLLIGAAVSFYNVYKQLS